MVDEDIERFDISVHDALGMDVIQSLDMIVCTSSSCLV